jgi:hypothetical protein
LATPEIITACPESGNLCAQAQHNAVSSRALSGGDYAGAADLDLTGSDLAFVVPLEELLIGAANSL